MFQKVINGSVRVMQRWMPEPFLFAVILTFIAALLAMPLCRQTPVEVLLNWGGGVWGLLAFAMQMALVLVTGSALASAPALKRAIAALANIPKSPAAAIALVTVVSAVACWLNWGFGLIVGVIFAKEIARRLEGVDYRLLIASAYSGFVVWHAGLSGSVPLKLATPGPDLATATAGAVVDPLPISQTILHPLNIAMVAVVIVAITAVNALMHPKAGNVVAIDPTLIADESPQADCPTSERPTPAQRIENSRLIVWLVSALGIAYLVVSLGFRKAAFDLGSVIMIFLFMGLLFHGTPVAYVRAFGKAASGAAGIILQFPFYAGIMGIITGVGESGLCLGTLISDACIRLSSPTTYPLLTFLCAALLNMFVPSGGGHWAIQAPIMFTAGDALGVDHGLTGMAIAWGDAWTNMIQPFWALPALAIAGLSAKDIMGFCLIDLFVSGLVIAFGLLIWAL